MEKEAEKEKTGSRDQITRFKHHFCEEEAKASMKCMEDNNYDRDKCLGYFRAFRDCKKAFREAEWEKKKKEASFFWGKKKKKKKTEIE